MANVLVLSVRLSLYSFMKMANKIFLLFLLASFLCAQENIAVLELEADGVTPSEARTLTNKLRGELMNTGKYTVVERGQMDVILKEQGFQSTGCTSEECVVEVGQLLGVQNIVAGSIGKVGGIYLVSLRMIDVARGKILRNAEEEVEGDLSDVLRVGLYNAARKLAGLEADKAYKAKEPAPAPTPEPPPPPHRMAERAPPSVFAPKLGRRGGELSQEQLAALEQRKVMDAYRKERSRKSLSLAFGRSLMASKNFNWQQKDSFNLTFSDLEWESGPHWGFNIAPIRYYANPKGHSFIISAEMGLSMDKNVSASSLVHLTDSLFGGMGNGLTFTLPDKAFEISRYGFSDNLLMGARIAFNPFAIEPYTGIGLNFDFDFITGKAVQDKSLSTFAFRFNFPLGLKFYYKKVFLGFEYNSYFKSIVIDDNLDYDTATGESITGGFSDDGIAYWALNLGFIF